ncbi:transmembrane protein 205 [Condylostylus longicornis]|uniref:transmembrane protein 205 n=1 Tax=Condylostylus longicornis TaxID=2530218 RepID=UPI00244E1B8E|nr:transmembrane protein 205 [Condylostylus longicornis]
MAAAFLGSNLYNSITKTTQPAHIISLFILLFVLYSIWPEILGYGNKQKNIFLTIIYILSVATHFGALIWMTFFSGLALYFSLPRHTFGQCQHVLFPMYFALNAILSIIIFISFIKIKSGTWNKMDLTQIFILGFRATTEIIVRLYFAPMIKTLMKIKYSLEKVQGSGKEVGYLDQKDLSKCPQYQNVNKRFRKIHAGAAIGNLTALACSVLHLLYLATKISIS